MDLLWFLLSGGRVPGASSRLFCRVTSLFTLLEKLGFLLAGVFAAAKLSPSLLLALWPYLLMPFNINFMYLLFILAVLGVFFCCCVAFSLVAERDYSPAVVPSFSCGAPPVAEQALGLMGFGR